MNREELQYELDMALQQNEELIKQLARKSFGFVCFLSFSVEVEKRAIISASYAFY